MASTETIELPNSALVVSGINDLAVKPYPLVLSAIGDQPIIPDGHVLLKVKATGICGSDVCDLQSQYYHHKLAKEGNYCRFESRLMTTTI